MRKQLINVVNSSKSLTNKLDLNLKLLPPTQIQMRLLRFDSFFFFVNKFFFYFREIITKSLLDQIAKRVDQTGAVPKGAYKCQKLEVNFIYFFFFFTI